MTITYSLWQGSQLLSVNNKASKPEEILAVIEELNKPKKMSLFSWSGTIDTTLSTMDSLRYYKHFMHG